MTGQWIQVVNEDDVKAVWKCPLCQGTVDLHPIFVHEDETPPLCKACDFSMEFFAIFVRNV